MLCVERRPGQDWLFPLNVDVQIGPVAPDNRPPDPKQDRNR
jgi:hypothetical protein